MKIKIEIKKVIIHQNPPQRPVQVNIGSLMDKVEITSIPEVAEKVTQALEKTLKTISEIPLANVDKSQQPKDAHRSQAADSRE